MSNFSARINRRGEDNSLFTNDHNSQSGQSLVEFLTGVGRCAVAGSTKNASLNVTGDTVGRVIIASFDDGKYTILAMPSVTKSGCQFNGSGKCSGTAEFYDLIINELSV